METTVIIQENNGGLDQVVLRDMVIMVELGTYAVHGVYRIC